MKFNGKLAVQAPRNKVFDRLRDARSFASCIEGVRDLTETKDGYYSALFETRVAFMHFKINVAVEIARIERPNLIEAKIEGQLLGIVGRLNATSSTMVVERGEQTRSNLARFIRNRASL